MQQTNETHDSHAKHGRRLEHRSWGVTTNEDYEPLSDGVRLDLVVLELVADGIVFRLLP